MIRESRLEVGETFYVVMGVGGGMHNSNDGDRRIEGEKAKKRLKVFFGSIIGRVNLIVLALV